MRIARVAQQNMLRLPYSCELCDDGPLWAQDISRETSFVAIMAVLVLTPEQELELGSPDLRFLLERQGVEAVHQRKLFKSGIDTLDKFSAFATGEPDLFQVLKDEFSLDPAANLKARHQVASFMAAWKASKTRVQRQADAEAEQDIREWIKPIPTSEYIMLRQAYAKTHGAMEEKVTPSKEFLEKKLLEVEHGEFKAESLQEVTTRDELDPDTLTPVWDSKGNLTVKRGSSRVPMLAGCEELRHRLNVMRNTRLMLALKFPGRTDIGDVTHDLFERYKEYLLGDFVHNLQAKDSSDQVIHRPSWQLVLSYEQAIRKQAFRYMISDNMTLAASWEKAWKDPVTKERHFSTPLSLCAKRQPSVGEALSGSTSQPPPKGFGRGKGKKGAGKGKNTKTFRGHAATKTGEPICFRFNQAEGCAIPSCKFKHVCSHCFDINHNFIGCSKRRPAADTAEKR